MNFWVGGRAFGKTTHLIQWMRAAPPDEQRVMICSNEASAATLRQVHPDLTFVSVNRGDFRSIGDPEKQRVTFAVDNVDLILSQLLHVPVQVATATGVMLPKPPNWDEWAKRIMPEMGTDWDANEIDKLSD